MGLSLATANPGGLPAIALSGAGTARPWRTRVTRARADAVGEAGREAPASAGSGADPAAPTEAFVRGQDFIRRCIAGDPATRDEFVAQYGALVRYAVAAVLRARDAALLAEELEDLTQSVLLSFFDRDCRRLKMYEGRNQASFATFVRVCATRQTLDHLRSLRRKPPIAADSDADDESRGLAGAIDPAAGPEERAATARALERLRDAVARLPAREQLLVRLHFVLGCDASEVASAMGVSENAVHVLKSRVKAKLRTLVDLEDDRG
ncbi:MAG TPA: sigma-70 family RNA polymerase sigma factor [Candidatus Binatia bacterium]|nr:sigma-70 family RNA polymerase sigma factor [Candidatus Binatia bacterium]